MSEHTKTPWAMETVKTSIGLCFKIGPFPSNGVYPETHACVYADNIHSHDLGHSKVGDELHANAAFIVTACNSHEALKASCINMVAAFNNRGETTSLCTWNERMKIAIADILNALAGVKP